MTVSYTCQKPIKFWAKCKINLLYKLNQSLLCVPGCPLLLATRLRTWALLPSSSILCSSLTCIHRSISSRLRSCLSGLHLASFPTALLLCYPLIHRTCFTNPQKTSSICYSASAVLLRLIPFATYGEFLCSSPPSSHIFLNSLQISTLSLSLPSVSICYLAFFVPQFLCL